MASSLYSPTRVDDTDSSVDVGSKTRSPASGGRDSPAAATSTGQQVQRKGPRSSIIAGGSLAPLSREPPSPSAAPSPTNAPGERKAPLIAPATLSARGLAPLGARPSLAVGSPPGVKTTAGHAQTSPSSGNPAGSFLAGYNHVSIHAGNAALQPTDAPNAAYSLPSTTGIIIALHVGERTFLTSPETLLRVSALEGVPMGGAKPNEVSLLLWIGEDAAMKHRETLAEAGRNATTGTSYSLDSPSGGSLQQRRRQQENGGGGSTHSESSPRSGFLPQTFDSRPPVGQCAPAAAAAPSAVHHSSGDSQFSFHAPTYSYFLDRSPTSFPLVLEYLRNGPGHARQALAHVNDADLHALSVDAEFFQLHVLSMLVAGERAHRSSVKYLSPDDLFWREVCETIDQLYPVQQGGVGGGGGDSIALVNSTPDRPPTHPTHSPALGHHHSSASVAISSSMGAAIASSVGSGSAVKSATPRHVNGSPTLEHLNGANGGNMVGLTLNNSSNGSGNSNHNNNSNNNPSSSPSSGASGAMTHRTAAQQHSHPAARSIGNMLRRLAFSKDPMLRVCHATYNGRPDYEERLLEILHTTCTLCRRQIFLKPIGLREGRDTGCPVHPAAAQWDRKLRIWSCCGSPDFANSGCQFTGIHYTTWVFWNTSDRD